MLNNKITVVTGVSMGIGLATAKKFIKENATVIGLSHDEPAEKLGKNFIFIKCDVSNENDVKKVSAKIEADYGRIDSLISVCDKEYKGGVLDLTSPLFQDASRHIVEAPMLLTKYFSPLLHQSANGSITLDIPVSALMKEDDFLMASLNTSLVNYVRQSASVIKPVRINAAMYGLIKGHLLSKEKEAKYTDPKFAANLPAGRLGLPEDVANFNAFLASDKCRYINSAAMQIDGGLYTMNPRSMGSAI